jgi:hypothetical protein
MMPNYIVMLRGNTQEWKNLGADETQRLMEKYVTWVERLKSEKRFHGGSALTSKSKMLRADNGKVAVIDGPYAETKEAVTGYFIIEAETHDQATEIATCCPALLHGESVEVTELGT